MSVSKTDKIIITGGAGFLGSFVVEKLKARGYTNLIVPRRKEYDLTHEDGAQRLYKDFKPEVILASFHGVPKDYVDKGDPYATQCAETVRLLRERLKLDANKFMLTFQSRFGRAEWLQPYTDMTVKALAERGVKNLAIVTPGFTADCLETLEEIAGENAEIFHHAGGKNFAAIPCLNDTEAGMAVISHVVRRELQGWINP